MNKEKFLSSLILACVAASFLAAAPATAQESWESYAAKFVCNAEHYDDTIIRGKYRTIVNIHNPNYLQDVQGLPIPLTFYKKVVLAIPQGEQALPPSCHQQEVLEADWALGVDCDNIKTLLGLSGLPTTGDLEGFVVIQVPPQGATQEVPPLDVTVVYTARPRSGTNPDIKLYDVRTMDVESVAATLVIGDPVLNPCPPD